MSLLIDDYPTISVHVVSARRIKGWVASCPHLQLELELRDLLVALG